RLTSKKYHVSRHVLFLLKFIKAKPAQCFVFFCCRVNIVGLTGRIKDKINMLVIRINVLKEQSSRSRKFLNIRETDKLLASGIESHFQTCLFTNFAARSLKRK